VKTAQRTDIYDPDNFMSGVPHDGFDWLREHDPVAFHPEADGIGFWSLISYGDVLRAGRDWETFSSGHGGALPVRPEMTRPGSGVELMMINMDPPAHTRLRSLVNKGFTPRRVRLLEDHVREIAANLIDEALPKGEVDFVTEIASDFPLQVIMEMVGVPLEDRHKVLEWSNMMIGFDDPDFGNTPEKATQAAVAMYMYWEWLAEQHRAERRDDLISVLMQSEVGETSEPLTNMEIDTFLLLLAVAGNETTRNLITGGLLQLFKNPGQWQMLLERPELLHTGVEEMLRYITPVMHFRRWATKDVQLGEKTIQEGDGVTLWYVAANRDPKEFPDPHRFDITRSPNEHVGFGTGGPHFCLGANLARLEIRVMFEELLKRTPEIEQTGEEAHLRSTFINGTKHLPVRFAR
jgi:cholest-4-en-3-one 26-monooxygenase